MNLELPVPFNPVILCRNLVLEYLRIHITDEHGVRLATYYFPDPETLDQMTLSWLRYRGLLEGEVQNNPPFTTRFELFVRYISNLPQNYKNARLCLTWAQDNHEALLTVKSQGFELPFQINAGTRTSALDELCVVWLKYREIIEE